MNSGGGMAVQGIILVAFVALMYFLLIRPQKKKEKSINEMRNGVQVGDEIITIGGICGKVVKTKDETIVIQVGASKVKFEMMRWSVSSVVSKSNVAPRDVVTEEEPKKMAPKRLKRSSDIEEEEVIPEDER